MLKLNVARLRDSIRWAEVERSPGSYTFDTPRTSWPVRLAGVPVQITLTLNWGNPLYDNGKTPHSPRALAAFGRFAAAVVQRFPQVDTLEIGNEVNGGNFVNGPVKTAGLSRRGRYHLAMVRAAADAVEAVRPDVTVIGGSTHSLPAGFLWPLLELPGASAVKGLALHPYTTPIDQLPEQIGFLRRQVRAARLPLYITEFGSQKAQRAADDLVRGYATLAALGVAEMDWYPLNERGDGMIPLIGRDGRRTGAGKAFRLAQSWLAEWPVRNASPDPFTFVYVFGANTAVVWGAPRALSVDATVKAFDATGTRLSPDDLALREDRALILRGPGLLGTGMFGSDKPFRFGCTPLIADSFYQFGYPLAGKGQAQGDPFTRSLRLDGHDIPFEVMPGQQRRSVPWTPYLGRPDMINLRLMADSMLPDFGARDGAIVHRYAASKDRRLHLIATFATSARSTDGISVIVMRDGRNLTAQAGTSALRIDRHLVMRKGQTLTVAVSPRSTPRGDTTRYRIRLFDEEKCRDTSH
ncbi:hypothetical protein [Novosphingobium malaysiense]|uniref:hypothetical protein n=1 Tax=Novosphingobium malaysiense TaxID=1348853 RepID=UPI000A86F016|nr:hypothetical protein [Novosphingobium malaysiense]